jgi:heme/copper-type cytochrome/quinol oxidase subunit 4
MGHITSSILGVPRGGRTGSKGHQSIANYHLKFVLSIDLGAIPPKMMMPSSKITSRPTETLHKSPWKFVLIGDLLTLSYLL